MGRVGHSQAQWQSGDRREGARRGGELTRHLFLCPEAVHAVVPDQDQAAASKGLCQDHVRFPLIGEGLHAQCRLPNSLEPGQF